MATTMRLSLILLGMGYVQARTWVDVMAPKLYRDSPVDVNRMRFALERDPFDFSSPAPTTVPAPTDAPALEDVRVSSTEPSSVPSPSPVETPAPTGVWESQNGGCADGEVLYEVRMYDVWGDGWGSTQMRIRDMVQTHQVDNTLITTDSLSDTVTIETEVAFGDTSVANAAAVQQEAIQPEVEYLFEGSLESGFEGYEYMCLDPSKCYMVEVHGDMWQSEVRWDIRHVELGISDKERAMANGNPVAKGMAPDTCRFSIPNAANETVCDFVCSSRTEAPTAAPTKAPTNKPTPAPILFTRSPTKSPTMFPSGIPSDLPSLMPSDGPSMIPSDAPSRLPSSQPSSNEPQYELMRRRPWRRQRLL